MIDAIETVIGKEDLGMTGTGMTGPEIETETITEATEVTVGTEVSGTTPGATALREIEGIDLTVRRDLTMETGIAEMTTGTESIKEEAVTTALDPGLDPEEREKERRASARK